MVTVPAAAEALASSYNAALAIQTGDADAAANLADGVIAVTIVDNRDTGAGYDIERAGVT